jgi:hypothetical protein
VALKEFGLGHLMGVVRFGADIHGFWYAGDYAPASGRGEIKVLMGEGILFGSGGLLAQLNASLVMMKHNSSMFVGWQGLMLAIAVLLYGLLEPAYCQTNGSLLLLRQTPRQGGTITPDVGVHHFDLNADVTLMAVPKPGYQFICWLGDVSEPTANQTIVYLDTPKIVIAAFERLEYEFLATEEEARSASVGGLFASSADYRRGGFTGSGGRKSPHRWTLWTPSPEEELHEDFPVLTPEPAMVCLLSLGGLALLRRRRAGRY